MSVEPRGESARPTHADVVVGTELAPALYQLTRADLIRYAAASGDLNTIHWDDKAAAAAGLPDVIAQGMLTMALGSRALAAWSGDPGGIRRYQARFLRPVPVAATTGVQVRVQATVTAVLPAPEVEVNLTVSCQGHKVLGRAKAIVALG